MRRVISISVLAVLVLSALLCVFETENIAEGGTIELESDSDFIGGQLDKVSIVDSGSDAYLQLSPLANGDWDQIEKTIYSRYHHAMCYSSNHEAIVLFGGFRYQSCLGDTWVLQNNQWILKQPINSPSARYFPAMVYDSFNDKVVLFGGLTNEYQRIRGDTWLYDIGTNIWTDVTPSNSPIARYGHAMTYDSLRHRVILFGGLNYGLNPDEMNDTWEYDTMNNTWKQIFPIGSPPNRWDHAMAYDSTNDVIVLFGGRAFWNFNDTWEYDPGTKVWSETTPVTHPTSREGHALSFDASVGRTVLFGGRDSGSNYVRETWEYDATTNTWQETTPANSPYERGFHTMAYDSINSKIMLFGGSHGQAQGFGDTWIYDASSDTWSEILPPDRPGERYSSAIVYDSINDRLVLFGGYDGGGNLNDTWEYDPKNNDWEKISTNVAPSPRRAHAMTYDSSQGVVVLFGGYGTGSLGDTWEYDAASDTWTETTSGGDPSPRYSHAMAYDSSESITVLQGGYDDSDHLNDTWEYNALLNNWVYITLGPTNRSGHAMVYAKDIDQIVSFGGTNSIGTLDDTFEYDATLNTWAKKITATIPGARSNHSMAFSPLSDQTIMFGGLRIGSLSDTWVYYDNAGTRQWVKKTPSTKPNPTCYHCMAYDPEIEGAVLFGGTNSMLTDQTWVYDEISNIWTLKTPWVVPSPRQHSSCVYDSINDEIVLFGGRVVSADNYLNDMWTYDTEDKVWNLKYYSPGNTIPKARATHSMVFIPSHKSIILFGGESYLYETFNDTWMFNVKTNDWTNMTPSFSPPSRYSTSMVYDPVSGKVVVFGGYSMTSGHLNDTWVYDIITNTWQDVTNPANAPPRRRDHTMIYDEQNKAIIMHGGYSWGTLYDDTWEYNVSSNTWTHLTSGPAVSDHSMVYDSKNKISLVFCSWTTSRSDNSIWAYDYPTNTWTLMKPGSKPEVRVGQSCCYIPMENKMVMYSGQYMYSFNDLWEYTLDAYEQSGSYISPPISIEGTAAVKWESIKWNPTSQPEGTSLIFQVCVDSNGNSNNFLGPDGTPDSFYESAFGSELWPGHEGQFLRYRVILRSDELGSTPKLDDVQISYSTQTVEKPSVRVTSPNGGEDWIKGKWYPITWIAEGEFNSTPVCLYYSTDSGATWTAIDEWIANTGYYNWTVPNINTGNALIRANITDIYRTMVSDTSDASFAIDPPPQKVPPGDGSQETDRPSDTSDNNLDDQKGKQTSNDNVILISIITIILFISIVINIFLLVIRKGNKKSTKKTDPKQKFNKNRIKPRI